MIKLHVTKKLLVKLPINKDGYLPNDKYEHPTAAVLSANPLNNWHANIIVLQRCDCILLVHSTTRFPLFIPCLSKPDFANLNWFFQDALMNTLLKLGATQQQLDTAITMLDELCIDSVCDRSVQGTMNQMKGDIERMLCYDNIELANLSAYRTAVWLSERPCTIKGYKDCIWPHKAMLALLTDCNIPDAIPDNVVHLKAYQNN